jgi:hypothetical protein
MLRFVFLIFIVLHIQNIDEFYNNGLKIDFAKKKKFMFS